MLKTMDNLYTNDTMFSHAICSSWYNKPKEFNWVRDNIEKGNHIIITDVTTINNFPDKKVYGWLIEPPELTPSFYQFVIENENRFEKIFTYDKRLLDISDKFVFLPIGGCWIDEKDRMIHNKSKLLCSITSNKSMISGHRFRLQVLSQIKGVDKFGFSAIPINNKIDVLKDYMFSVVVENQKLDFLFTEKIIDCFVTGTIPIYCGCPSISKFFDMEGIITFSSIEECQNIINNLTPELYNSKMGAIKNNFELAKKYVVADDILYDFIKNGNKFNY
jgi:hypothetical protein